MKAHWKKHKRACKGVRSLRRSSAIFTGLFLELTRYTPFGVKKSISEEDGMIIMVGDYPYQRVLLGKTVLMKFPCELADSEEQALACRTAAWCQHVIGTARMLFEEVIRRKDLLWIMNRPPTPRKIVNCCIMYLTRDALITCHLVEEVHFAPKNAHKPIRHVEPDGEHDSPILSGHAVIRVPCGGGLPGGRWGVPRAGVSRDQLDACVWAVRGRGGSAPEVVGSGR